MAEPLPRALIEFIHDTLVSLWMPFDENIDPQDFKDLGLIESAVNRPFQTYDGVDLHPSLARKGAALFHSLVCNHCFHNGNKRTAVIALDIFLSLNHTMLILSSEEVYKIAIETAQANSLGLSVEKLMNDLTASIEEGSVELDQLSDSKILRALGLERLTKLKDKSERISRDFERLMSELKQSAGESLY